MAKVRFRRKTRRSVFLAKRPKFLKVPSARLNHSLDEEFRNARSVDFFFEPDQVSYSCRYFCGQKIELKNQLYLVLGVFSPSHSRKSLLPQLAIRTILPWFSGLNSKDFRLAEKNFQQLKCPNVYTSRSSGTLENSLHERSKTIAQTWYFWSFFCTLCAILLPVFRASFLGYATSFGIQHECTQNTTHLWTQNCSDWTFKQLAGHIVESF